MGTKFGLAPEQIGMKAGMLITALFPLLGTVLLVLALRYFRAQKMGQVDQKG
jgi:hypothetical protein